MSLVKTTALAAAFTLAAFAAHSQTVLNFGHTIAKDSHYGKGVQAFGAKLAEVSGGKYEVREHAAGSLGGERDMIEGLSLGTVDLLYTGTPALGNFTDSVAVMDLPFLFDNYEAARTTLDGPVGDAMLDKLNEEGFTALGWIENGFRHLSNSVRPVVTPADMKDLKIRTQENALHIQAFEELGAAPTPMAFPELFAAMQQGTVDGQENPLTIVTSSNFFEVQKHLSLTGHIYGAGVLLASPTLWDSLSEEEQGWFREATKAAIQATRDAVDAAEAEALKVVKEHGMEVVAEPDTAAFREAVQGVYQTYREKYGPETLDLIISAQKK